MGVFAEAIEQAASQAVEKPNDAAPHDSPAPDSSPESPATPPGTAPLPPQSPQQQEQQQSPQGARTPQTPQQRPGEPAANRQVDLRALQEARQQTKALRDTYGWLPREEAQPLRQFYSAYRTDPVGTLLGELETFVSQPQGRQRITETLQQWGVLPRSGNGQPQPAATNGQGADDPEPQPDFRLADGTPFMSAPRQAEWLAWAKRQDEKRFDEKLAPIQQWVTQAQREQVRTAAVSNANQFAERIFTEAKTWPHFTENRPAIAEKYAEFSQRMGAEAALYRAYLAVMHEQVLPTLSRSERTAVAQELQQRTRATTPNPTRPTGTRGDRRPETFREAAERVLAR